MKNNPKVSVCRHLTALLPKRLTQAFLPIAVVLLALQSKAQFLGNTPVLTQYSFNLPFAIDGHLERQSTTSGAPGDWTTSAALFPVGGIFHPVTGQGSTYPVTLTRHIVDPYNGTDDVFASGAKANDNPNTSWNWTTGSADGKVNVNHAMIHVGRDAADNTWIMLAADRESQNGTSYIDFEFLQAPLTKNANGTFNSAASNATGGRTPNDVLVSMEYVNGGSTPNLLYYKWQLSGSTYDWVPFSPGAGSAYAATNSFVTNVPFGAFGATSYPTYAFVEAAVNVTTFVTIGDPCSSAGFSSLFIKTKASNSSTAVLKDLVGPIQLNFGAGFTASASAAPITCNGGNSTITVTASGGVPPYQYRYNGGAWTSSSTLTVPAGGPYLIEVRDANLCLKTADSNLYITEPAVLSASTGGTNVACYGGAGSANVTAAGGTSPYTYSWNTTPVQTTAAITGVPAGNYLVTVTDANGCSVTASRSVTQPAAPLSATMGSQNNVSCHGAATGSATVIATGGTTPYTYSWNTAPDQPTATATGLPAGNYTVSVVDANGCTQSAPVTITQPASPLAANAAVQQQVLCYGQTTGTASVVAAGGTAPYSYSWNSAPVQTTASALNLGAGNYVVTVTDAQGCVKADTVDVTQPASQLGVSISSQTNILCAGSFGAATVSATGGTAPYTYFWNTSPVQTTAAATNLAPASYTVGVTDANGCAQSASVTITAPPVLQATLSTVTHLQCHNDNNGTASVNVTGGVAPYTYSWNTTPVQTTASVSNLPAGNYTATVTDANGCMDTVQVTVTQPTALTPVISVTNLFCEGGTNGSATVTMYGGTPPYSYSWNTTPVQTTQTAANLTVGTYTVSISDANGCVSSATATLGMPSAPLNTSISSSTMVPCYGQALGSATVAASGGTAPYTYTWNTTPVQQTATAAAIPAGSYNVIVTDNNGCNDTAFVTITQPATPVSISLANSPVSCFNGTNGTATATTSGGQPPYTYAWNTSPVQSTATAVGLAAGSYTVTVTDANGCAFPGQVTITQPSAPVAVTVAGQTNVACKNNATGSATVAATGGTGAYSYVWNTTPAQTAPTATNLTAGNYSVTVSDANGCSQSTGVTISQPLTSLNAGIAGQTNINCYGNATGTAVAAATGGTAPYTFAWNTSPVQTTTAISGIGSGTYSVLVTDANGCLDTAVATITQPASPLTVSIPSVAHVSCYGLADGWANASVGGGTPPYTYSWNTLPAQTTAAATGLAAGSYSITVTDQLGCVQTATMTVSQPAAPAGVAVTAQTNVMCYGAATGSVTVAGSGGTAPYSYIWNTAPVQTGATATGLSAGTYSVSMTDANGCAASVTATITQVPAVNAQISASTMITCNGAGDGTATVSATGGTQPYTYSWNTTPVQTGQTATGLGPAWYTVTVTDVNGCTSSVPTAMYQPAPIVPSVSVSSLYCAGATNATANVAAAGGTPPYTYTWNTSPQQIGATATNLGPGSYTVTITDAHNCTGYAVANVAPPSNPLTAGVSGVIPVNCFGDQTGAATAVASNGTPPYTYAWNTTPAQLTATASGLAAGTYTVTTTDAHGCAELDTVIITQPAAPLSTAIVGVSHIPCFGLTTGAATLSASGGSLPYSYTWNTIPAQATASAVNLAAGTYTATVTDANGCMSADSVVITQPTILNAAATTVAHVSCYNGSNGSALVNVTGGSAPYAYSWNTTPVQTGASAANLAAGTYTVTVTDANGCTDTAQVTVTQPAQMVATVAMSDLFCLGGNNGSATVNMTGGITPYTYSWNTTPVQTTATAGNLTSGSYSVMVTDANGCVVSASATIAPPSTPLSAAVSASVPASCFNTSTGTATAIASGGAAPYAYSWNTVPAQTTAVATGLAAGTYNVIVTDTNGCMDTAFVTITQPASAVGITVSGSNVSCFGGTNGTAMAAGTGGTPPYSYGWNTVPAQTVASLTNLPAGTYLATVTDANGCVALDSVQITQPNALNAAASTLTNVACFNGNNGSASVNVIGGTTPYTYSWNTSPVQTAITASNLSADTYAVTVTDGNGCMDTAQATVNQPAQMVATVAMSNLFCIGGSNGSATVNLTGGVAPYTYSWNTTPVQTTATAVNLTSGSYSVTVTDANGCVVSTSATIAPPAVPLSATVSGTMPASCFSTNTGTATALGNGGAAPYTYLWNTIPAQTTATATGLGAGTYNVVVTDDNGCMDTATVTITQPATAVGITVSGTAVTCYNGSDGTAQVSGMGGTPPYTYAWNTTPVQNAASLTNLSAGVYTATLTDANGCVATDSVTISQPNVLAAGANTLIHVSCYNGDNGSATVNVTGGTAPYTYSWNTTPAQTGAAASNLPAGIYTVTVTDANGCLDTAMTTVNQPAQMVANVAMSNLFCLGGSNGAATVNMTGGVAPYSYSWNTSPVQTTATAVNLSSGSYTVTVTDANGCAISDTATIAPPAVPLSVAVTGSAPASCFNTNTGTATALGTGGAAPYAYSWNTTPAQTTATATGIGAGTYAVIVTDNNGCMDTATVTISQPASAVALTATGTNISCYNGTDGTAAATAAGGTAPYSYAWNMVPAQTTAIATGLAAGIYTATVTDANGCTATQQVTLTQPAAVSAAATVSDVQCFGLANGSAIAFGSGGTAPYTYSWNSVPAQAGNTATSLAAGMYTVTITDANGCSDTAQAIVNQPAQLIPSVTMSNLFCSGGSNGSATVNMAGGVAPYSYFWNTSPVQTTATAVNLTAGVYSVTVTDANGCVATATANIAPPAVPLTATISGSTPASCFNTNTGSATAAGTGGASPYTYSWNTVPAQTAATATSLAAGTYDVIITDANGCMDTAAVTISQPATPVGMTLIGTNVTCNNGTNGEALVTGTGGTPPYTYLWNTVPAQTTPAATGLPAGIYTATVTDANGCTATQQVTLTQPSAVVASIASVNNVQCFDLSNGGASATGSGGTGPYTYSWNTIPVQTGSTAVNLSAGTYTVTVTDANGCTDTGQAMVNQPAQLVPSVTMSSLFCSGGSNGSATANITGGVAPYSYSWNTTPVQTTATAINLTAGAYIVTVTDANGCVASDSAGIASPVPVAAAVSSATPASCFNTATGAATAVGSGGTAPYTYSWNTLPAQVTATATGLAAGAYDVVVTDANGCTDTATVTITQPASAVGGSITGTNVTCYNGSNGVAVAAGTGGTPPYTYLWNTAPAQSTATATGLAAGIYAATITDANGCTTIQQVTLTQPSAVTASVSGVNVVQCFDLANGSATAAASGGTAPYTYSWNTVPAQTSATAAGLPAGTYIVTVSDANGCTDTTTATVNQPAQLVPTVTISNLFCSGGNNGSATVNVNGGVSPYTYSWNTVPAQATATAVNLSAGGYTVAVTDANGCVASATATVGSPAPLAALINTSSPALCFNTNTGSATAAATGGTAPYTYSWTTTPAQATAAATGLGAGNYSVVVTDVNGCMDTAMVTITQPASPVGITLTGTNVTCFNGTNGEAVAAGTGGTAPYTYAWNTTPVQTTATASGLAAGVYTATVTDANGCTFSNQLTLTQPTAVTASVGSVSHVACFGLSTGTATVSAAGGTAPYTYAWNTLPVQTGTTAGNLPAGSHVVTVTDSFGCTGTVTVTINQPLQLTVGTTVANIVCYGDANGSVTANVAGGTAPYTYNWNILQNTPSIQNLPPGNYSVTVTDANGCAATASTQVTMPQAPLSATIAATPITCFGNANGTASAAVTGGTAPFTYLWNTVPAQTASTASGLNAGSYTVVVTDVNGCQDSSAVSLTEPAELIVSAQELKGTCPGEANGRASVSATGGVTPYAIAWNTTPVQTASLLQNLPVGTYTATVTDANGCVKSVPVTVQAFPAPDVNAGPDSVICEGQSIGLLATGAESYTWGPFGSLSCYPCPDPVATPEQTTTYRVIGINSFNCRDTDLVTIGVLHDKPVSTGPDIRICTGESATLSATGGGSYLWIPATGLSDATSPNPAVSTDTSISYTLIITHNRCFSDTLTQSVTVHERPTVMLGPDHTGIIGSQYRIPVAVTNASSISWTPSTDLNCSSCFEPTATLNTTVTYTATVSNEIGCTASDDITIRAICDNSAVFIPNTFTPNGDGTNDFFMPLGSGLLKLDKFSVYSRWGELMYQATNVKFGDNVPGWDGTFKGEILKPDVYVYIIEATCPTNERISLKGDISLIR